MQPIWINLVVSVTLSFASVAESDVVTDWNTAALNAIRASQTAPSPASRILAILHTSIYDAVNGIARTHEPYFVKEKGPTSASEEAAASAAAHKVLPTLLPMDAATFNQLHQTILAGIRDNARKRRGLEWGDSLAEKILDWRENDGSTASREPPGSNEPGDWQPTPPPPTVKEPLPYAFPQWGFVTPFAMPTSSFFRPNGPPALGSARYAADYNEVKAIGEDDSTVRTDEQTDVALFWADGTGTVTPPGHWNVIAKDGSHKQTSAAERSPLHPVDRDHGRCGYRRMGCEVCLQLLAAGHRNSRGRNGWKSRDRAGRGLAPLNRYPPFPDYISGHSTFSGAAAAVLSLFYGTPRIPFSTTLGGLPNTERRDFSGFLQAAREAALSRMYGGIHFRSANDDGLAVGLAIGAWTFKKTMGR